MKHILSIILILFVAISLVGCKIDDLPFLNRDTQVSVEDTELKYKIDKVILSKGYQAIKPSVEVVKKNNDVKLLVSVGLIETSGVKVDQIVKKGNIINIHVLNELEEDNVQLAIPQIFIELVNAKAINLDDIKFNIINDNFSTIGIKLCVNDVINKVKSDFNVTANTLPDVNLSNINERYIWNITYNSIFDKDNYEAPLVNLSVDIDANSGEVLKSAKRLISSYIDEGQILDYIMDNFLLYRKNEIDANTALEYESLWCYDIKKNESSNIYRTNSHILSASFSPDYKQVSLIENNGTMSELFIIRRYEKKAYKIIFDEGIIPSLVRWYDKDNIYVLDYDDNITNLFNYNIVNDKIEKINSFKQHFIDLRVNKDFIILVEKNENNVNNNIYYTDDFRNLRMIDSGLSPRIISNNKIAYSKTNEKDDRNILHIFNLDKFKEYDIIDKNIASIFAISENELLVLEKNQGNNNYTIHEYSIDNKVLKSLTNVNSHTIFYNKEKNLIYVDLIAPFETDKKEFIYSVDLSKLASTLP